jgi:hypothetical protein
MRSEYKLEDLGEGVRGKYNSTYKEAHNIVLLDPEVAKAFPSEEAVNEALLGVLGSKGDRAFYNFNFEDPNSHVCDEMN